MKFTELSINKSNQSARFQSRVFTEKFLIEIDLRFENNKERSVDNLINILALNYDSRDVIWHTLRNWQVTIKILIDGDLDFLKEAPFWNQEMEKNKFPMDVQKSYEL